MSFQLMFVVSEIIKKKGRALFHNFKHNKYDIICLQETHITEKDKSFIEND